MIKDETQVNFRMPVSLKKKLERAAKDAGRSLTAEIVWRLERTIEVGLAHFDIPKFFEEVENENEEKLGVEREHIRRERESIKIMMEDIKITREELRLLQNELTETVLEARRGALRGQKQNSAENS